MVITDTRIIDNSGKKKKDIKTFKAYAQVQAQKPSCSYLISTFRLKKKNDMEMNF